MKELTEADLQHLNDFPEQTYAVIGNGNRTACGTDSGTGLGKKTIKGHMYNFKKHGEMTYWHKDGSVRLHQNYKEGLKDGVQRSWFENGDKQFVYNYKNGNKHGVQQRWLKDGKVQNHEQYEDGILIKNLSKPIIKNIKEDHAKLPKRKPIVHSQSVVENIFPSLFCRR